MENTIVPTKELNYLILNFLQHQNVDTKLIEKQMKAQKLLPEPSAYGLPSWHKRENCNLLANYPEFMDTSESENFKKEIVNRSISKLLKKENPQLHPNYLVEIFKKFANITKSQFPKYRLSNPVSLLKKELTPVTYDKPLVSQYDRNKSPLQYLASYPHNATKAMSIVNLLTSRQTGQRIASPYLFQPFLDVNYNHLISVEGHYAPCYCITFDKTGRRLITASDDRTIKIWSVYNGVLLYSLRGHEGDISDISVDPTNQFLASASESQVRIWSLVDNYGQNIHVLRFHATVINVVAFSPSIESRYLLTCDGEGKLALWNCNTWADPMTHSTNSEITSAIWDTFGKRFATGSTNSIDIWSIENDFLEIIVSLPNACLIRIMQWCPFYSGIAVGSTDGSCFFWKCDSNKDQKSIENWEKIEFCKSLPRTPARDISGVSMLQFSSNGNHLVSAHIENSAINVWCLKSGNKLFELALHKNCVFTLLAHPRNPRIMISAGYDGLICVIDIVTGKLMKAHRVAFQISDGAFAKSGDYFAFSGLQGNYALFGMGSAMNYRNTPTSQYFSSDNNPLVFDLNGIASDSILQLPSYLIPRDIVNRLGVSYRLNPTQNQLQPIPYNIPSFKEPFDNYCEYVRSIEDNRTNIFDDGSKSDNVERLFPPPEQLLHEDVIITEAIPAIIDHLSSEDEIEDDDDDDDWEGASGIDLSQSRRYMRRQRTTRSRAGGRSLLSEEEDEQYVDEDDEERYSSDEDSQSRASAPPTRTTRSTRSRPGRKRGRRAKRTTKNSRSTSNQHALNMDDDDDEIEYEEDDEEEEDVYALLSDGEGDYAIPNDDEDMDDELRASMNQSLNESQLLSSSQESVLPESQSATIKKMIKRNKIKKEEKRMYPKWMTTHTQFPNTYIPQLYDEVVYMIQGHFFYIKYYKEKKSTLLPIQNSHVRCKVSAIQYKTESHNKYRASRRVLLTLKVEDLPNEPTFEVLFHPLSQTPDFLVLKSLFDRCKAKEYIGRRFVMVYPDDSVLYYGRVTDVKNRDEEYPNSPWETLQVDWERSDKQDSKQDESISFWEIEIIDDMEDELSQTNADENSTEITKPLPSKSKKSSNPKPLDLDDALLSLTSQNSPTLETKNETSEEEDNVENSNARANNSRKEMIKNWRTPQDIGEIIPPSQADNIIRFILQIFKYPISIPFQAPVDIQNYPDYFNEILYPIDLQTIINRLKNSFYRRTEALIEDLTMMENNAITFNKQDSLIAKSAQAIVGVISTFIATGEKILDQLENLEDEMEGSGDEEDDEEFLQNRQTPKSEGRARGRPRKNKEKKEDEKHVRRSTRHRGESQNYFDLENPSSLNSDEEEIEHSIPSTPSPRKASPKTSSAGSGRKKQKEEEEEEEEFCSPSRSTKKVTRSSSNSKPKPIPDNLRFNLRRNRKKPIRYSEKEEKTEIQFPNNRRYSTRSRGLSVSELIGPEDDNEASSEDDSAKRKKKEKKEASDDSEEDFSNVSLSEELKSIIAASEAKQEQSRPIKPLSDNSLVRLLGDKSDSEEESKQSSVEQASQESIENIAEDSEESAVEEENNEYSDYEEDGGEEDEEEAEFKGSDDDEYGAPPRKRQKVTKKKAKPKPKKGKKAKKQATVRRSGRVRTQKSYDEFETDVNLGKRSRAQRNSSPSGSRRSQRNSRRVNYSM